MGLLNSKIPPKTLKDLTYITEFTKEEIQQYYKSFRKDCPSGKLSIEELKKLYKKRFPMGDASFFAEHAFRTFDTNGDGTIDFREFLCGLSVNLRGSLKEKLEWTYNMYDQDKDGAITKTEVLEIIMATYKMYGQGCLLEKDIKNNPSPEQHVERMFNAMDKDGDELITLKEFTLAVYKDPSLVRLMQVDGSENM
ncbi:unnamed protein product [Clavelina lepadiformis]|uniref:EF-hand domain-containing protein n=1 Tax=Clavelina lepadiformis TaxID=159417 RepID=A0ABP0GIE0_CLALP